MVNFRIEISLPDHARRLAKGERLPDEALYGIVAGIEPPLLSPHHLEALKSFLDVHATRGRGRPRRDVVGRASLIVALQYITRSDVPDPIIPTLVKRVADRRRFTEFRRAWPFHQLNQRRTRDMVMEVLVEEVGRIRAAKPPSQFPELEALILDRVPPGGLAGTKTYDLVSDILLDMGFDPLAIPRIRNIISARKKMRNPK